MKTRIVNIVIGVMIAGLVGGLIIAGLFLDILEFHPDFSFTPSVWLLWSGLIAWAVLFFWAVGGLMAKCAGKAIPPYEIRLVAGWLVGLVILFLGGGDAVAAGHPMDSPLIYRGAVRMWGIMSGSGAHISAMRNIPISRWRKFTPGG